MDLPDIDILKFDFLDARSVESLQDALKQLFLIDAIDSNGTITTIRKTMADSELYECLLSSNGLGSCVEDNKLADVAAVSAGNNQEVGSMITEAMSKVQRKGVVTLEETKSADNYLQVPQTLKMQNLLGEARVNGNLVMFI
ncbi:probable pre-mRNA-splicing factor ATP-dependent RNA helicase DEAH4 [Tanacetum coccineum]